MKILIVFSALTLLNCMFFAYQSDMNSYIRESAYVKEIADECAVGASAFYDEEAMSEGFYAFDRENCEAYVTYLLGKSFEHTEDVSCEIQYSDVWGTENPSIEVIITVEGKDRFRLPFITVNSVKRAGHYEITGY